MFKRSDLDLLHLEASQEWRVRRRGGMGTGSPAGLQPAQFDSVEEMSRRVNVWTPSVRLRPAATL